MVVTLADFDGAHDVRIGCLKTSREWNCIRFRNVDQIRVDRIATVVFCWLSDLNALVEGIEFGSALISLHMATEIEALHVDHID